MNDQRTQPNSTDANVTAAIGLTTQQEQAASLLASGLTVQNVADHLKVHRSTLWHWRQLETFEAYLNSLKQQHRISAEEGILSMQEQALETVRRVMSCENDAVALKAAQFVLSAVKDTSVGSADVMELVRQKVSQSATDSLFNEMLMGDPRAIAERCHEIGI